MRTVLTILFILFTAYKIVVAQGSSVASAATMSPNSSFGVVMDDNSRNHYWKVTITSNGYWRIQLTSASTVDVDVSLYDTDGARYLAGDSRSGTSSEAFTFLKPGTYYLYCYRGGGSSGSYTVTSTFQSPSRTSDLEPNDTYTNGSTLAPTGISTGHLGFYGTNATDIDDYWKITTTQDGWLRIQVQNDSLDLRGDNIFDVDMGIYDVNGASYIAGDSRTGASSLASAFLRPGSYYVKVYRGIGRAGSYQIRSDFFTAPRTNDPESNDTYQTASSGSINSFVTGHLGYYSNGTTDLNDYWKFTLQGDGKVAVQVANDSLDQAGAIYDVDFSVYDADGATYITGNSSTGSLSSAITYLKAGTYYVKTYRGIGAAGSYSLTINHTPPPLGDDGSGNEAVAGAKSLTYSQVSSGHLGFYGGGSTNTQDYWKFVAPSTDTVYVHIVSNADIDVDFSIYSSDGVAYVTGDSRSGTISKSAFKATSGATYYVRAYRGGGNAGSYSIVAQRSAVMVGVETHFEKGAIPTELMLAQNYPNPFNPTTSIQYGLPESDHVQIVVFSLLGQEIAKLTNAVQSPGTYRVVWNGKDQLGKEMPSGIYLIRLQTSNAQLVRKAMLLR